jgi:hypothetical protein
MSKEIQPLETLLKIHNFYIDEAQKCYGAKAYFAGCVMLASALETTLLVMVDRYKEEINTLSKFPMRRGEPTAPINWTLSELLDIAAELNWLPRKLKRTDDYNTPEEGEIGDDARIIQEIRNLVHPGKYLRAYPLLDITEQHFFHSFVILEEIIKRLHDKLKKRDIYFGNS